MHIGIQSVHRLVFPGYELPSTGGVPGTFAAGLQYDVQSLIPVRGPRACRTALPLKLTYGDDPIIRVTRIGARMRAPPTRTGGAQQRRQKETRLRFIPSGLGMKSCWTSMCA